MARDGNPPTKNKENNVTSNATRNVTLLLWVLLVANLSLPISIAVAQAPAGQNSRPAAAGPDAAVKVTEGQAREIALKAMPGKITDVAIEKKRGRTVYTVEIRAEKDGAEVDILVDVESGQIIGMDR
jgi:uncharacterized membrane protein YkoI